MEGHHIKTDLARRHDGGSGEPPDTLPKLSLPPSSVVNAPVQLITSTGGVKARVLANGFPNVTVTPAGGGIASRGGQQIAFNVAAKR